MSLSHREQRLLNGTSDALRGSDPHLAAMLATFARLAAGDPLPDHGLVRRPWWRRVLGAPLAAITWLAHLAGRVATAVAGGSVAPQPDATGPAESGPPAGPTVLAGRPSPHRHRDTQPNRADHRQRPTAVSPPEHGGTDTPHSPGGGTADLPKPAEETAEAGGRPSHVIVVGVDGRPASLRAAAYAAGLARRQGAQLVCVYVRPDVLATVALAACAAPGVLPAAVDTVSHLEAEVRKRLTAEVAAWGLPARFVVRTGDPLTGLVAVADELGADAIVVGASARRCRWPRGSVGTRLLRRRRWPVTVVP